MKFYPADIRQVSSELLKTLEKEKVATEEDLERMMGQTIALKENNIVDFQKIPSNFGTMAYTVSYIRPKSGIPLELKINTELDYSQVILKAQTKLEQYKPFTRDGYGNIVQNRLFMPGNFNSAKEELKRLTSIKDR